MILSLCSQDFHASLTVLASVCVSVTRRSLVERHHVDINTREQTISHPSQVDSRTDQTVSRNPLYISMPSMPSSPTVAKLVADLLNTSIATLQPIQDLIRQNPSLGPLLTPLLNPINSQYASFILFPFFSLTSNVDP